MLDEPLGQLDRGLRERLVVELRELFGRLGTTVLAVTHDQGEAFALADRVVVMRDGRIAQAGTPLEVWQRPASEFVARFLGFDNVVDGDGARRRSPTPLGQAPGAGGHAAGRVHGCWSGPPACGWRTPRTGCRCTVGRAHLPRRPCRRARSGPRDGPAPGGGVRAAGRAGGRGPGRRRSSTRPKSSCWEPVRPHEVRHHDDAYAGTPGPARPLLCRDRAAGAAVAGHRDLRRRSVGDRADLPRYSCRTPARPALVDERGPSCPSRRPA